MEGFSEEQLKYITCNDKIDPKDSVKLLATAGSGKTLCIIRRIEYIIEKQLFNPCDIFIFTFSKNACEDFKMKIRKHKATTIKIKNVYTIDSFAWNLLGDLADNIDVSILSYSFMIELEKCTNTVEIYEKFPLLENVKIIFIDEAQDLNETQSRIVNVLYNVCNISVNLIGDPNQNIFQFRDASDKYLLDFPAHTFYLTQNYRSKEHIVKFSSHLRPYKNKDITAFNKTTNDLKTMFYSYNSAFNLENQLLYVLENFKNKKIPLHKVAILSPTRGYLKFNKGSMCFKGLCFISNFLYQNNIKFSQFYSDNKEITKITYKPVKDHINLMTYTSSKGLEWDYVILIDANAKLISYIDYSHKKYQEEQYLLYVAASRPRKNLIIFCKQNQANPWFKDIPEDCYTIAKHCRHNFDFYDESMLFNYNKSGFTEDNIDNYTEAELYNVYINIKDHVKYTISETPDANVVVPDNKNELFTLFLQYILTGCTQSNLVDIENIITQDHIITCNNDNIIYWYYKNRDVIKSWPIEKTKYPKYIVEFIDANIKDASIPFNSYTFIDKYYSTYVYKNKSLIEAAYNSIAGNGNGNGNIISSYKSIFTIVLTLYALKTTHYFYIQMCNEFCRDFLTDENIRAIEFIKEKYNGNVNVRCTDSTTLKDIIKHIKTKEFDNEITFWNISNKRSNLTRVSLDIPKEILDKIFKDPISGNGVSSTG